MSFKQDFMCVNSIPIILTSEKFRLKALVIQYMLNTKNLQSNFLILQFQTILQKMHLRIEKNDSLGLAGFSHTNLKQSLKNKTQDVFNYQNWRNSKSQGGMTRKFSKSKTLKTSNTLRTLLSGMSKSKLGNNLGYSDRKMQKDHHSQICNKDILIRSIDCQESPLQPACQILIKSSSKTKKFMHRATTVEKLQLFLMDRVEKVVAWKTYPQNIALDFYLTMKQKDVSFLNGQILTLQAYKTQKQNIVNLNSFDIIYCIGTGGFSKVYLCRFKQDGKFYAMKVIDKNFIVKNKKKKIVMNQKKIMEQLKHPFVIQMKFSFESKSSLIFILQLCPGGQLFGLVKKFRIMNQNIAKFYMIEILLGLQQVHKNGIVYRDFKPENILIDMEGHIRIADFGLAKPGITHNKQKAYSFCGSPQYMPPQMILKKGHSLPVDFYCLGALLYELVTGLPPFYSEDPNEIYSGTISKAISFPSHAKISEQLKNLLKSLLCKDQDKRLGSYSGVKEVLAHPWFHKINKQAYLRKQCQPPVRFTGIKDLKLIFGEMEVKNQQYINQIKSQQQKQLKGDYEIVMEKFYFDYRCDGKNRLSHKSSKQNSVNNLSLNSYRNSTKSKSKQKSLKNIFTQRSQTGKMSMRKKPLSTRYLDLNLYLK